MNLKNKQAWRAFSKSKKNWVGSNIEPWGTPGGFVFSKAWKYKQDYQCVSALSIGKKAQIKKFKDVRALCSSVIDSRHVGLILKPGNRPASLLNLQQPSPLEKSIISYTSKRCFDTVVIIIPGRKRRREWWREITSVIRYCLFANSLRLKPHLRICHHWCIDINNLHVFVAYQTHIATTDSLEGI